MKVKSINKSLGKIVSKFSLMALIAAISCTIHTVYADEGTTCANKKQIIQTKIDAAKQHKNSYQVDGLEKALNDVNTSCNDNDLEAKYKKQVQDKTDDVAKRIQDLKEAQLKGDAEKMAKQESKLLKDKAELTEAKSKLAQFYKDLKTN